MTEQEREMPNLPINYEEQIQKEIEEMSKRLSAPSGDRIRTKGNQKFIAPNGVESDELVGVITDFVSSNMYYDAGYDPQNPSAPACFAIGNEPATLIPSGNSPNKQSDTCAACPNNQFGSAAIGRGKACKNTRLLAIIAPNEPESSVWVLSVPPASIKDFDGYVTKLIGRHRTPPIGVVTRISLSKDTQYSSLKFEVDRALTPGELTEFMGRREESHTRLTAEPDVTGYKAPNKPQRNSRVR